MKRKGTARFSTQSTQSAKRNEEGCCVCRHVLVALWVCEKGTVDAYQKSLIKVMRIWGSAKRFHAHCWVTDTTNRTGLQPRADAVKPTPQVPVEQFETEFVSEDGRKFSQLANFVFAHGAYRYVGKGRIRFGRCPMRCGSNQSENRSTPLRT